MGSNSSKNANTFDATNIEITPQTEITTQNIESTPSKVIDSEFEDPRSPTLHRTPLSSPSPVRSWRKIAAEANFDPRSPSLQRTPTHKLVIAKMAEPFDPRSPSIMRTPLSNLADSEEVAMSSPYVAGRSIAKSVTMEEAPASTPAVESVISEKAEASTTEEPEEQTSFADSAEMKDALRKDGASLTMSLDASMQLYNSAALSKDFQKTAMQSVEIVQSEPSEETKKDPNSRKRRKNHKNRESYASSPLKKSYSPVMTSDAENSFSLKQLHNNTPPRSPLSTLSSNRMSSPIEKSKLNINLFENLPPTIAL